MEEHISHADWSMHNQHNYILQPIPRETTFFFFLHFRTISSHTLYAIHYQNYWFVQCSSTLHTHNMIEHKTLEQQLPSLENLSILVTIAGRGIAVHTYHTHHLHCRVSEDPSRDFPVTASRRGIHRFTQGGTSPRNGITAALPGSRAGQSRPSRPLLLSFSQRLSSSSGGQGAGPGRQTPFFRFFFRAVCAAAAAVCAHYSLHLLFFVFTLCGGAYK